MNIDSPNNVAPKALPQNGAYDTPLQNVLTETLPQHGKRKGQSLEGMRDVPSKKKKMLHKTVQEQKRKAPRLFGQESTSRSEMLKDDEDEAYDMNNDISQDDNDSNVDVDYENENENENENGNENEHNPLEDKNSHTNENHLALLDENNLDIEEEPTNWLEFAQTIVEILGIPFTPNNPKGMIKLGQKHGRECTLKRIFLPKAYLPIEPKLEMGGLSGWLEYMEAVYSKVYDIAIDVLSYPVYLEYKEQVRSEGNPLEKFLQYKKEDVAKLVQRTKISKLLYLRAADQGLVKLRAFVTLVRRNWNQLAKHLNYRGWDENRNDSDNGVTKVVSTKTKGQGTYRDIPCYKSYVEYLMCWGSHWLKHSQQSAFKALFSSDVETYNSFSKYEQLLD
jgi:hypothetical protein